MRYQGALCKTLDNPPPLLRLQIEALEVEVEGEVVGGEVVGGERLLCEALPKVVQSISRLPNHRQHRLTSSAEQRTDKEVFNSEADDTTSYEGTPVPVSYSYQGALTAEAVWFGSGTAGGWGRS